jgi:hypothetical protein
LKEKECSEENIKSHERVKLDMHTLCKFFRSSRYKEYKKNCGELKIFWDNSNNKENNVSDKRNFIIHQAQGMTEDNLYDFWSIEQSDDRTKRQSAWMIQLLKFLNFIAKEDLEEKGLLAEFESFKSLEEASLMKQVHQALETAIANL